MRTGRPTAPTAPAARRLLDTDPAARRGVAIATALGFGAAALLVAATVVLTGVVADVAADGAALGDIAPRLWLLGALAVGRAAAIGTGALIGGTTATAAKARLRRRLAGHLVAVGPAALAGRRTGELAGVQGQAVDDIGPYLASYRPARALAVAVPLLVAGTIVVLDPWTTLVLLFAGPMLVLLLALIGSRTRALTERRERELRWLDGFFLDVLQGLATLKAFGRSREEADTIEEVSAHFGRTTMEVLATAFQTSLVMEWAAVAATAFVAVEVGFRLVERQLTFSTGLAVLVLTPEFFTPLRRMALEHHAGRAGDAAAERILGVLDEPPATDHRTKGTTARVAPGPAAPRPQPPGHLPGGLELRGVWAQHPGAGGPALRGVDLVVGPGERVALVGPSGAGKSTVAALILALLRPEAGTVRADGVDLTDLDPEAWRRRIGWVPQRPHLFAGTVADNIRLGLPGATDDDVVSAAVAADADRFIRALPAGYATPIGERGMRLSGGQRQRLALARAFLRDPAFLVLDEPTAHLDAESERAVLTAVERLATGRTTLLIAHRPLAAATADRVVRLEDGRVVGDGPARAPADPAPGAHR